MRVGGRQTARRSVNRLRPCRNTRASRLDQHYIQRRGDCIGRRTRNSPCSRLGWTAANCVLGEYVSADFTNCAIQTDSFPLTDCSRFIAVLRFNEYVLVRIIYDSFRNTMNDLCRIKCWYFSVNVEMRTLERI